MVLVFRLEELLLERRSGKKKRGVIRDIVKNTGLPRHKVAALYHSNVRYISLETLSLICDYLVEEVNIDASLLPGILFARDPSDFWEILATRSRLDIALGVRSDKSQPDRSELRWVVAPDAMLLGELRHQISLVRANSDSEREPQLTAEQLIDAPRLGPWREQIGIDARNRYGEFADARQKHALVCLGTIKSNPLVEMVVSSVFGSDAFVSMDQEPHRTQWPCPFVLQYRAKDPQPPSCFAGTKAIPPIVDSAPGIFFEEEPNKWVCCPCTDRLDAALIFYAFRRAEGSLEVVLGGFSARSTHYLANALKNLKGTLLKPRYESNALQVGAVVVRFECVETASGHNEVTCKPFPLTRDVLAKYISRKQRRGRNDRRTKP